MPFSLIKPSRIDNFTLLTNSVTGIDYAAYLAGTTYALGDRVTVTQPSATVTLTIASPCVVSYTAHGLLDNELVFFTTTGALPTGLLTTRTYYVQVVDADSFYLAEDRDGLPVSTTGTQSGVHTLVVDTHYIYESLQAANLGNTPRLSSTWWQKVNNTNPYRMFDESPSAQTVGANEIHVQVQGIGYADAVAVMNVNAATARFRMQDTLNSNTVTMTIAAPCVVTQTAHGFADGQKIVLTTTGALPTGLAVQITYYLVNTTVNTYELSATLGGASITTTGTQSGVHTAIAVEYDSTYALDGGMTDSNWYSYYYDPIARERDFVELEMPHLSNGIIDVWLSSTNESVSCGNIVIGQRFEIGDSQYGATVGIQDYSVKQTDAFGNYTILQRAYAKRGNFTVWLPSTRTSGVATQLADYRALPIVYIGSEIHSSTIIYGFYKDFSVDIAMNEISVCTIQIDGLK